MGVVHGRAGGGGAAGVGAFVRGLLEEVVLQGVERRDARLGVVVQHAQDQVLELQVVTGGVAWLTRPPPPWTACLHPQNLMETPCGRRLVLLKGWTGMRGERNRRKTNSVELSPLVLVQSTCKLYNDEMVDGWFSCMYSLEDGWILSLLITLGHSDLVKIIGRKGGIGLRGERE